MCHLSGERVQASPVLRHQQFLRLTPLCVSRKAPQRSVRHVLPTMSLPLIFAAQRSRSTASSLGVWGLRAEGLPKEWAPVLQHMRSQAQHDNTPRLQCLVVFAGKATLTRALGESGLQTVAYDPRVDPAHDVLTEQGLVFLLEQLVRLESGGMVWIAPPCSSWIWRSRGVSQRSVASPDGDVTNAEVKSANDVARVVARLLAACDALGLGWVIEQPLTSLFWYFEPIATSVAGKGVQRVRVELSRAGAHTARPLILHGTPPWLPSLEQYIRPTPCPVRLELLRRRRGRLVVGIQAALRRSTAYPPSFCAVVAEHQKRWFDWVQSSGHAPWTAVGPVNEVLIVDDNDDPMVNGARTDARGAQEGIQAPPAPAVVPVPEVTVVDDSDSATLSIDCGEAARRTEAVEAPAASSPSHGFFDFPTFQPLPNMTTAAERWRALNLAGAAARLAARSRVESIEPASAPAPPDSP